MTLMKLKSIPMLLAAAALGLTGCQDQLTDNGGVKNPGESSGRTVFFSAAVALPSTAGTRSATDDFDGDPNGNDRTNSDENEKGHPDYEYGYEYENDVRTMILVIATTDDKYITHSVITEITAEPTYGKPFDFTVSGEIEYDDLAAAYKEDEGPLYSTNGNKPTVKVYAYCNYTGRLLNMFESAEFGNTDWIDWPGEVIEEPSPVGHTPAVSNTIWAPRSFLMTSAENFEVQFPSTIDDWDDFADKSHPYKMTGATAVADNAEDKYDDTVLEDAIKVERVAARIDFKDGSEAGGNLYHLFISPSETVVTDGAEGPEEETKKKEDQNLFDVQLTRMALVNMSKQFHYLRRVSADGTDAGWEILGREKKVNYVVDTDWEIKANATKDDGGYDVKDNGTLNPANAFNFPLYKSDASYNTANWYADAIETVLEEGASDTWTESSGYKIWRYVTENTIPGFENQKTVQSTGVVFKGSIVAGEDINGGFSDEEPYVSEAVQHALQAAAKHYEQEDGYNNDDEEITWNDLPENGKYDYPILYSFEGMLYAGVEEVVNAAARDGHNGTLYMAVSNILGNWYLVYDEEEKGETPTFTATDSFEYMDSEPKEDGKAVVQLTVDIYYDILNPEKSTSDFTACKVDLGNADALFANKFMALAPTNNFTLYKASNEADGEGWGYYCYYFYWNRHNDNKKSGEMGPMEFATVRNNVYKLAVKNINSFGHPRVTVYDPEPEKPGDDDEKRLRYFQVQVEVLPWVVRVNDISF